MQAVLDRRIKPIMNWSADIQYLWGKRYLEVVKVPLYVKGQIAEHNGKGGKNGQ